MEDWRRRLEEGELERERREEFRRRRDVLVRNARREGEAARREERGQDCEDVEGSERDREEDQEMREKEAREEEGLRKKREVEMDRQRGEARERGAKEREEARKKKERERRERLSKVPTHYQVLGVERHAPLANIKRAYHVRARQVHPDRHAMATEAERGEMEGKMKEVAAAYTILSDMCKRAEYDSKLAL